MLKEIKLELCTVDKRREGSIRFSAHVGDRVLAKIAPGTFKEFRIFAIHSLDDVEVRDEFDTSAAHVHFAASKIDTLILGD
jgi:hypothetical protein